MNKLNRLVFKLAHKITHPVSGQFIHNTLRTRVLIVSENHILLVRTSFGTQKWSLPGGGVHKHENPEDAAVREVEEEAGLVLDVKKLKKLGEMRLPKNKKWPVANIRFFATKLDKRVEPTITRKFEIMEAKWFPLKELPEECSDTLHEGLSLVRR